MTVAVRCTKCLATMSFASDLSVGRVASMLKKAGWTCPGVSGWICPDHPPSSKEGDAHVSPVQPPFPPDIQPLREERDSRIEEPLAQNPILGELIEVNGRLKRVIGKIYTEIYTNVDTPVDGMGILDTLEETLGGALLEECRSLANAPESMLCSICQNVLSTLPDEERTDKYFYLCPSCKHFFDKELKWILVRVTDWEER